MKKILSIGLVVVIVLSLGAMSFADVADTFERGFKKGSSNNNVEPGYGRNLSDEEFNLMRESNRKNVKLGMAFNYEENGASQLASITDLTEEEILNSGLTLHELAEQENVLDEFHALILNEKTTQLNELIANGTFSQEKADFMINRMSNMDGSQEKLGQNVTRGNGRGFNRK